MERKQIELVSAAATVASGGTTATKVTATWNAAVRGVGTYRIDGVATVAPTGGANTDKITVTPAMTRDLTAGSTHTICSVGELSLTGDAQSPTVAACATFTVAAAAAVTPREDRIARALGVAGRFASGGGLKLARDHDELLADDE